LRGGRDDAMGMACDEAIGVDAGGRGV
jgi:hypothetical protein